MKKENQDEPLPTGLRGVQLHEWDPYDKPLDQRVREAEQYSFDFEEVPKSQQIPAPSDAQVCIGNCKVCPFCDGE